MNSQNLDWKSQKLAFFANYWERLSKLKTYSLQRRRERYRIIYVWKILAKQVPNISREGNSGIQILHLENSRNGRTCKIPPLPRNATPRVKRIREGSFSHHGPQLFNALPKDLRNLSDCSLAIFKAHLDKFLQRVDDKPLVRGYTAERQTEIIIALFTWSLIPWNLPKVKK